MKRRRDAIVGWLVVLGAVSVLVAMFALRRDDKPEEVEKLPPARKLAEARQYLDNAREAFDAKKYRAARKLADTALGLDPTLADAALLAGDAAIEFDDLEMALGYFERVATRKQITPSTTKADLGIARAHFRLGSHFLAEKAVRNVLAVEPTHVSANDLLAEILDVNGRRWDSVPYALEVARQGRSSLEALILLADSEFIIVPQQACKTGGDRSSSETWAGPGRIRRGRCRAWRTATPRGTGHRRNRSQPPTGRTVVQSELFGL